MKKVIRLPTPYFQNFDEDKYQYLVERLENTSNPLLKARYAHILWCSPRKHAKYAKAAVDSYLELIDVYERKDKDAPAEHFGLDVMRIMQNAYFLGYQIKYRIDEIKSGLKRLVLDFNFDSRSSFALRANVIKLMLKVRKIFPKEDFTGFQNICWKVALSLWHCVVHIFGYHTFRPGFFLEISASGVYIPRSGYADSKMATCSYTETI